MSKRWNYAAQGLLSGLSSAVDTMFKVEIEKDRENRLQAIADKNYKRDRADQLADIESQRIFQKELVADAQGFTTSEREASEGFQLQVISDRQDYEDKVATARFGEQIALQNLGEQSQIRLLAEAQRYPSSPLGKLIQDRDNAKSEEERAYFDRQIAMSQVFQSTDLMGNTTFTMPNFSPDNKSITSTTEVGGLRGLDSPRGDTTSAPEIDQDLLREKIDEVEAMPADENGMIMMERGPVNKQDVLRRYRARLISAAPAGSTSRLGFSYTG